MESDALYALLDNLKQINSVLDKITGRLEVLENDYKERSIKKRIFRYLLTLYPLILILLIFLVDADHHKISEITGDIKELIRDTKDLTHGLVFAYVED